MLCHTSNRIADCIPNNFCLLNSKRHMMKHPSKLPVPTYFTNPNVSYRRFYSFTADHHQRRSRGSEQGLFSQTQREKIMKNHKVNSSQQVISNTKRGPNGIFPLIGLTFNYTVDWVINGTRKKRDLEPCRHFSIFSIYLLLALFS